MGDRLLFRQLLDYESFTYTYLVADRVSRDAILIDSVFERVDRDLRLISELGLQLRYALETHVHADHVTGAARLREATGCVIGVGQAAGVEEAGLQLKDGSRLAFGGLTLTALATPGHTVGCLSYLLGDRVFTGDALFVRGTGRTDFQQGSASTLYQSICGKLYTLPDDTLVFPAHDYNGNTQSTIGEEKEYNPRIFDGQSEEAFSKLMSSLKLAHPKKIDVAVPANQHCGRGYSGQPAKVAR
ncbi:MAG: MBL fold metallo-hydrolase [Bdellovibrionales bacterium]|nr:MBL fold metallo-hydrolase [Bdellovibrionales bacterium]